MEKKWQCPSEKIVCRCGKTKWETLELTNYIERVRCKNCGEELGINITDFYHEHRGRDGKADEEAIRIYEEKCKNGEHPFEEFVRVYINWETEKVMWWCPICGAAIVSLCHPSNSCAKPSMGMPARRPKILERK